ncbi:alpha/beta-hydrolase [Atractiella rhizophila]|nr:alpha/beta-hydrolase [Atractiella rhizophila]
MARGTLPLLCRIHNHPSHLPVVVWFYGGDFVLGDTSAYDPILILQRSMDIGKPIIFASVNYRLSALGFLWHSEITKPEDANRGITDQSLALKWLQQNLEVFGGDPEKVTIWGESAGAFSVQAHTVFGPPNLFRSSIVASGYLLKDSQYPTNDFFWQVSSGTGCGGEGEVTPQEANQCLKTVPWQTIRDVSTKLNIYPRITGSFIDRPPKERILDQEYNKVPVLIGTTRDEGSISTPEEVNSEEELFQFINSTLNKNESSARTVLDAYKNDPDLQGQTWLQLASDYIGDGYYLTDRRFEAKHLSRTQPVWTYRFDVFTPGPFADLYGVHHGSDVGYFFPNAFLQFLDTSIIGQTPELLAVRNRLLDRWIYFITEQNPTAPSSDPLWSKYSESKEELIRFNTSGDDIILDDFRLDETNLLTTLIPAE